MSAPAPRTADGKPDFSVWGLDAGPSLFYIAGELKPNEVKPWVAPLLKERRTSATGRSGVHLPEGPRFNHFLAFPKKIRQTPS